MRTVVAPGGNALLRRGERASIDAQRANIRGRRPTTREGRSWKQSCGWSTATDRKAVCLLRKAWAFPNPSASHLTCWMQKRKA